MKLKAKVSIILLVSLCSLMALLIPRLHNPSQFEVTSQPMAAFEQAKLSGKPIFLEFYAKW